MLQGQQPEKSVTGTESWQLRALQQDQDEDRIAPKRMGGFGRQRLGLGSSSLDENRLSLCGVENYWRPPFTTGSSTLQSFPLLTSRGVKEVEAGAPALPGSRPASTSP